MATISSGSVTFTINAGEQYRVIATGEAYVDIGGGSTQSYRLINGSSERLLGGFIVATPVTIRVVSGSVEYINVSGTGDSVALSLAQSSRTDITGVVASTASGAMVGANGKVLGEFKQTYKLPSPVLIDGYLDGTATTGGSPASVVKFQPPVVDQVGQTLITSTAAATATITAQRNTTSMFDPTKMGVIAALFYVSGQKAARGLILQNSGGGGQANLTVNDSATTPLFADGYLWLAWNVTEFAAFYALGSTAVTLAPQFRLGLTGNTGTTLFAPGPLLCNAAGRTKVRLTFDDIDESVYTKVFPIVKALKIAITVFVPSALVDTPGRMTKDMLKEMAAYEGCTLCPNTTPDDSSVSTTIPTAITNLNIDRQYLIDNNLAKNGSENHGCWPNGSWDAARVNAFKAAGMLTMRSTSGFTVFDRFGLGSIALTLPAYAGGVSTWANIAAFDAAIDLAVSRGSSIHIYYHKVLDSGATGLNVDIGLLTQQLQSLSDRVKANQLDVVNTTDYWDAVKNNKPPVIY